MTLLHQTEPTPAMGRLRQPHFHGRSSLPAIAQHMLVHVPAAEWNPDAVGGSAAVSGSCTPFPGRQPVASSFLQHSRCYSTGSGRDQPVQESLSGKSLRRTASSGCRSPKPQRQQKHLLPWGDLHGEHRAAVHSTPGDMGSATSSGNATASTRAAMGQPRISLNQPPPARQELILP